ncbi:hypothetical protein [Robertkochia sediminum]|uniref:hypothetical protein n=1 Tax=Robertkochia sediminum TaxID=2785326 RepID=UPI001934832E|nr:hypothetical protein [Robertkochia sediminum]MBL7471732.1 hypothetical protein [Robertkochia sediminum]
MNTVSCPACKNENASNTLECTICLFPFNGTEKEKSIHIGKFISDKGVIDDSDSLIKKTQNILFVLSGLYTLGMVLTYFNNPYGIIGIIDYFIIIPIFLVSAFRIRKNPILFTSIPLSILLLIYSIQFLFDPRTIVNGILIKIIIIGVMGYCIKTAVSANKFRKKYKI